MRSIQIRLMEAAMGNGAKAHEAEQKSVGGDEGGEEEVQAASQAMLGEEEQGAHNVRRYFADNMTHMSV